MTINNSITLSTIVPPRFVCKPSFKCGDNKFSEYLLECSLHTLPKSLRREFEHVFRCKYKEGVFNPDQPPNIERQEGVYNNSVDEENQDLELLALPTNQHAQKDLVAMGDDIEAEKDRLLNVFMDFASDVCKEINRRGYWADYIDPCSGLPMLTPHCNKVYSEVDGMEVLLGYRSYNAGFCKILYHPKWGSSVYPATVFCYAPRNIVREILESLPTSIH